MGSCSVYVLCEPGCQMGEWAIKDLELPTLPTSWKGHSSLFSRAATMYPIHPVVSHPKSPGFGCTVCLVLPQPAPVLLGYSLKSTTYAVSCRPHALHRGGLGHLCAQRDLLTNCGVGICTQQLRQISAGQPRKHHYFLSQLSLGYLRQISSSYENRLNLSWYIRDCCLAGFHTDWLVLLCSWLVPLKWLCMHRVMCRVVTTFFRLAFSSLYVRHSNPKHVSSPC